MCSLCGALDQADHWTAGAGAAARPSLDRRLTAAVSGPALAHYGLRLDVWGGRFVLRGATGKSAVIPHLGALWQEAERLTGRACDPLDPALLDRIEAAQR